MLFLDYMVHQICRDLEELAEDAARRESIAESLTAFVNDDDARAELESHRMAGHIALEFLDYPVPLNFAELGISPEPQDLVIKVDRPDGRFIEPYQIEEIGFGDSRAWVMFGRENLGDGKDKGDVLGSSARVECWITSPPPAQ
ncbi:MAG: hypothetical protein ACM35H_08860, partial [Bacteroidota bacterium]|nr:hypothetical protein [Kiloniellaceae bacterium]